MVNNNTINNGEPRIISIQIETDSKGSFVLTSNNAGTYTDSAYSAHYELEFLDELPGPLSGSNRTLKFEEWVGDEIIARIYYDYQKHGAGLKHHLRNGTILDWSAHRLGENFSWKISVEGFPSNALISIRITRYLYSSNLIEVTGKVLEEFAEEKAVALAFSNYSLKSLMIQNMEQGVVPYDMDFDFEEIPQALMKVAVSNIYDIKVDIIQDEPDQNGYPGEIKIAFEFPGLIEITLNGNSISRSKFTLYANFVPDQKSAKGNLFLIEFKNAIIKGETTTEIFDEEVIKENYGGSVGGFTQQIDQIIDTIAKATDNTKLYSATLPQLGKVIVIPDIWDKVNDIDVEFFSVRFAKVTVWEKKEVPYLYYIFKIRALYTCVEEVGTENRLFNSSKNIPHFNKKYLPHLYGEPEYGVIVICVSREALLEMMRPLIERVIYDKITAGKGSISARAEWNAFGKIEEFELNNDFIRTQLRVNGNGKVVFKVRISKCDSSTNVLKLSINVGYRAELVPKLVLKETDEGFKQNLILIGEGDSTHVDPDIDILPDIPLIVLEVAELIINEIIKYFGARYPKQKFFEEHALQFNTKSDKKDQVNFKLFGLSLEEDIQSIVMLGELDGGSQQMG